jgi:hypothetical protein
MLSTKKSRPEIADPNKPEPPNPSPLGAHRPTAPWDADRFGANVPTARNQTQAWVFDGSIVGVTATTDWHDWHLPYRDHGSPLSRRLRLVQKHINDWLDERPEPSLRIVSICAGQGHDLLGVLTRRPDAARVRAELIEYDPRNVAAAQASIAAAELQGISAVHADAGDFAAYRTAAPADLILLAGVLGNISDRDVNATINALPALCASDAAVIWTRTRRAPDLTPAVRRWFTDAGFHEQAFHAPPEVLFSLGVHQLHSPPLKPPPSGRIFTFTN